jgi:hypothetical protein
LDFSPLLPPTTPDVQPDLKSLCALPERNESLVKTRDIETSMSEFEGDECDKVEGDEVEGDVL